MDKRKPKTSSKPSKTIPTTSIENKNKKILFSYEHLDLSNSKYVLSSIGDYKIYNQFISEYFCKIQEYSKKEKKEFSNIRWREINHIHPIDWKDSQIREDSFTKLDAKLMEEIKDDCWQLGINSTTFRMHGFFIENIFYVVWLDPYHQLYSRK